MTNTPDIQFETFIRTDQATLWNALTEPETIAAYHPAGARVEGLEGGGHQLMGQDGRPFIVERLIEQSGEDRLTLSFEPSWTDVPAPGSHVVFKIEPMHSVCKLSFEQHNCKEIGIGDNWARFVASLKSYLETGTGLRLA